MVDLHPIAVASHFLLAIIVFTLATVLLVDTRFAPAVDGERPGWLQPATLAFLALGLALIVSGAIVTTSGTHPGADDVPRLYALLDVAYWHVRIAVVYVSALAVFLFLLSRIECTSRRVPRLAWVVVALTAHAGRDRRGAVAQRAALVPRLGPRHDRHPAVEQPRRARPHAAARAGGQSFHGPQPVTRSGVIRRT